jgi:signal transduction histidine kinase
MLFKGIDEAVNSLEHLMEEAQELADEFERGRSQMIHLAGLGLMVEFLAHELNRATQYALGTLAEGKKSTRPLSLQAMQNLELQLKTLQMRLSTLDPATTSGRNRKERFDTALLAQQTLDSHSAEFERHSIKPSPVVVLPRSRPVEVSMVKGMVIQVLENLISNSVYWLKQEQRIRPKFNARTPQMARPLADAWGWHPPAGLRVMPISSSCLPPAKAAVTGFGPAHKAQTGAI